MEGRPITRVRKVCRSGIPSAEHVANSYVSIRK